MSPGLCGGELGAGPAGIKHQPDPVSFIIHSAGGVQTCTSLQYRLEPQLIISGKLSLLRESRGF